MEYRGLGALQERRAAPAKTPVVTRTRSVELTPGEAKVLSLAIQGMRDKDIAAETGLAPGTVKVYLVRARARLNLRNDRRRVPPGVAPDRPCDACVYRGFARFLEAALKQVMEAENAG